MGVLTSLGKGIAEQAPRLLARSAATLERLSPTAARVLPGVAAAAAKAPPAALPTAESWMPLVKPMIEGLSMYGPQATELAQNVRLARNLGYQAAGEAIAATRPLIKALTPAESSGLARVLTGEVTSGAEAAQVLTPRTLDLLRRGATLAQQSGRPFAGELQKTRATLSPRILRDGGKLFQAALQQEADPITQRLVRDHLVPRIAELPKEAQPLAESLTKAVVEYGGGTGGLAQLRAFNTATLLGRAVIGNLSQTGLSASVAPIRATLGAVTQFASKAGRAENDELTLRLGTALNNGLGDYLTHDLGSGTIPWAAGKVLEKTGFNAVERFNRRFATAIGDQWFTMLERQAPVSDVARMQLARHGVKDVLAAGARARFIQNFVRRTQQRLTPEELPYILSAPGKMGELARTAFQFKPFGYKAAQLMLEELAIPEQRWGYLARTLAAGSTVGAISSEGRRLTGGSKREPPGIPVRMLEATLAMGSAGLFADTIQAAMGGEGKLAEALLGPSGGLALEGAVGTVRALQGRPKPLVRSVVRRIPTVGGKLAGQIPSGHRGPQSILP